MKGCKRRSGRLTGARRGGKLVEGENTMRLRAALVFSIGFVIAGAAAQPPRVLGQPAITADPSRFKTDAGCENLRDEDRDGLDDGCEARLLNARAPLLHLADNDWTKPANVDWYLARVVMRFHHNNCGDDAILGLGKVTQDNLNRQRHNTKKGVSGLCRHSGTAIRSGVGPWNENEHFFLQAASDATHKGSSNPADWIVYGHAFPNNFGGINLQYWFFYPYNDNFGSANHESDWESVLIALGPDRKFSHAKFCAHGGCDNTFGRNSLTFYGDHLEVWVADGSHASYPSEVSCDRQVVGSEGAFPFNCSSAPRDRWFTWKGGKGAEAGHQGGGVVNVGEQGRGRVLNGQFFIDYAGGVWGEQGEFELTSGKRTPSFQGNWNQDRAP